MNISEEFLSEVVKHVADYFGFKTWSLRKDETKAIFENYFGILIPVTVLSFVGGEKVTKSIYIKFSPKNVLESLKPDIRDQYLVEAFTYSTLIPMFKPVSDIDIVVPELYYAGLESNNEFLILENMICKGYERYELRYLDLEHVILAVKTLAKFHSMSMILDVKGKNPDYHLMKPYSNSYPPGYYKFVELSLKRHLHVFESTPYEEYLKSLVTNFQSHVIDASLKVNHIVYSHGDYWRENLLFKYENNRPIQICLLDFQKCRKMSPAHDLLMFLLTCVDINEQRRNFQNILDIYMLTLHSLLDKHSVEPVYNIDDLNKDMKIVAPVSIATSVMSFSLWLGLETDNVKSKNICNSNSLQSTLLSFKTIICDMLENLINLKYIEI